MILLNLSKTQKLTNEREQEMRKVSKISKARMKKGDRIFAPLGLIELIDEIH